VDEIVAALAAQDEELAGLLTGRSDDDWHRPSPCEGWDVADVVLHLAQTNEMAIGSATGRYTDVLAALSDGVGPAADVDEGAALMIARDRGTPVDGIRSRFETSASTLIDALEHCDPHARVQWVAGELSARTLATTRLAETWIHTGDVAAALGVPHPPSDRLWHIARLAWRTLPYAFARAGREMTGPVAFDLTGPDGEPWQFLPDEEPLTTIAGDAADLCAVAARRVDPTQTGLNGTGPDAVAVLELVRTYA
jgi:uncharacterized protein (TIGR03084 family)